MKIEKPTILSKALYYAPYIDSVKENCALSAIENISNRTIDFANNLHKEKLSFAYAPNKWTIAQVLKHICDAERVYAYRLLCFARKDTTSLPGFDENEYVNTAPIYSSISAFLDEYNAIRMASISLVNSLKEDNLDFEGTANGIVLTPRILCWLIAGHNQHHLNVLKERY